MSETNPLARMQQFIDSLSEQELTEWARQAKIDYNSPEKQNLPESVAMFGLLETLTADFQNIENELTDAEWTAFRALCRVGATEGILRFELGLPTRRHIEYARAEGDYANVPEGVLEFDEKTPRDLRLHQARLTGLGERWSQLLSEGQRATILCLITESSPRPGYLTLMLPEAVGEAGREMEVKRPLMTEALTRQELAGYFEVGRNSKDLDKIPGLEPFGAKFRVPVSRMPPKYLIEKGLMRKP